MKNYSEEKKEAVLKQLLPPNNHSPQEVSKRERLALSTIYKWRNEARAQGRCLPDSDAQGSHQWSSQDRFAAVVESATMNSEQRAEYCRRRGLYPTQLNEWRQDCERAGDYAQQLQGGDRSVGNRQQQRIRELEKELRRKESALAETAALLTLSKKARAIWGGEV